MGLLENPNNIIYNVFAIKQDIWSFKEFTLFSVFMSSSKEDCS